MHAIKKKVENSRYTCPMCDRTFDSEDISSNTFVVFWESAICDDPNRSSNKCVSEWWEEEYWICADGCIFSGSIPLEDEECWVCKNCDNRYEDREEAADCCL